MEMKNGMKNRNETCRENFRENAVKNFGTINPGKCQVPNPTLNFNVFDYKMDGLVSISTFLEMSSI